MKSERLQITFLTCVAIVISSTFASASYVGSKRAMAEVEMMKITLGAGCSDGEQ